jgi:hypothetical protein
VNKAKHMKNSKLYESLSALSQKSLEILAESTDKNHDFTTERTWVKQNNNTYFRQEIKQPFWGSALYEAKDEISKTKEFSIFSEVATSDPIISPQLNTLVGTCMSKSRFELFNLVFKSLFPFLTDSEIIGFDESVFKAKYLKIENELYSNEIEAERLTPLCGFSANAPDLILDSNLSIVKLSEREIVDLLRIGIKIGDSFGQENFIHNIHQFAIKLTYRLPKVIGEKAIGGDIESHNRYIKGDKEQAVLNALRLYKEGKVCSFGTVTKSKSVFDSSFSYNYGTPLKPFMRYKLHLSDKEKEDFLEFWKVYQGTNIPEKHFLSVAIRRFSQANERESIEDKIIDFLISAEALFLSSGGSFQGELKYRLSHRAAMFIDDESEKQRKIFKFMQKAYDVRSAIVHGATPKLPKKKDGTTYSLDGFCKDVEAYLRVSLNKTINLVSATENPNKIFEWDSIIFPTGN